MADSDSKPSSGNELELREQDKWLPIANVARIMKSALPENAKVSKEAKECMQECVSEFISFITSEASEKCAAEKRKTVNGEDILFAMLSLGFENYAEALKIYLTKYRQNQNYKQENKSERKKKTLAPPDGAVAAAAAGSNPVTETNSPSQQQQQEYYAAYDVPINGQDAEQRYSEEPTQEEKANFYETYTGGDYY
ncbi:Transcriptional activator HAP3 [Yarrowia sp. B02]|nr:Transcriptional activator HAP3 [Yarrowia sp. B02]